MSEATPRDWKVYKWTVSTTVTDGKGKAICSLTNKHRDAHAELIVRAVNSFDDLLTACKKAMTCGLDSSVREIVASAIAKAEKQD